MKKSNRGAEVLRKSARPTCAGRCYGDDTAPPTCQCLCPFESQGAEAAERWRRRRRQNISGTAKRDENMTEISSRCIAVNYRGQMERNYFQIFHKSICIRAYGAKKGQDWSSAGHIRLGSPPSSTESDGPSRSPPPAPFFPPTQLFICSAAAAADALSLTLQPLTHSTAIMLLTPKGCLTAWRAGVFLVFSDGPQNAKLP